MSVPRLEDAWNTRDGEAVAAAFTSDGVRVEHALPGARLKGRAAIARQAQAYIDAVPDCVLRIQGVHEGSGPFGAGAGPVDVTRAEVPG